MLDAIVSEALAEVIVSTGRWIATGASAPRGRKNKEAIEIASWFDTYKLTAAVPEIDELSSNVSPDLLTYALRSDEIQTVLHELLAARLTDAPEADINRVRSNFKSEFSAAIPGNGIESLGDTLFSYYDSEICILVGRLEGMSISTLPQIRSEAFFARTIAVLNAIEKHASSLAGRVDSEVEARFLINYRNHADERFGKIQPPDFERRQRIPIEEIYVKPNIYSKIQVGDSKAKTNKSMRQQGDAAEPQDDLIEAPTSIPFDDFTQILDRTVLLGDPGGGKSTASAALMHLNATDTSRRVPFLVVLREFAAEGSPSRSVIGHIEDKLETLYQCKPPSGLVSQLFLSGRALIIFDGLDELIDPAHRVEITEVVEQFCLEYPLAHVLVTSRVVGYDLARLDDKQFTCYRIAEFSDQQVTDYASKWFVRDESLDAAEAESWANAFIEESNRVSDLRSNPLMLALMCILYHGEGFIPRNRPEVYQQCADLLFRKWDTRRRINVELRTRYLIEPALRHLAYWLFTRDVPEFAVTESELIAETTRFLNGRGFESPEEAQGDAAEFVSFCKGRAWVFSDAGTTADGQVLYTFTHRTFLEYFTAAYIAILNDTPEELARVIAPHVANQEWEIVAELAVQKKDQTSDLGAERVIKWLLANNHQYSVEGRCNVLQFVTLCLNSIDLPPRLVREVTREDMKHLLAGSLTTEDYYLPMASLLSVGGDSRQVIAEEFNATIAQMIDSTDQVESLKALRLAVHVSSGVFYGRQSGFGTNADFWVTVAEENTRTYADAIIRAAANDLSFKYLALMRDLISAREALATSDRGLSELFVDVPVGIFGSFWMGYAQSTLMMFLGSESSSWEDAQRRLAELGEVLNMHPESPWVELEGLGDIPLNVEGEFRDGITMDAETYLFVAAVIIIFEEYSRAEVDEFAVKICPQLIPYIALRRSRSTDGNVAELPRLPISAYFQELFDSWAAGDIRFTRQIGKD